MFLSVGSNRDKIQALFIFKIIYIFTLAYSVTKKRGFLFFVNQCQRDNQKNILSIVTLG